MQTTLFIPEPLGNVEIHNLFYFLFEPERLVVDVFGQPPFPNFFEKDAVYTNTIELADAIILPHNFKKITNQGEVYIKKWLDEGEKKNIPVYIFCFGDFSYKTVFDPRAWVFLMSSYTSILRPRDIIVPTTARLFDEIPRIAQEKRDKPVVSFCGFAGFKTKNEYVKYCIKNLKWDLLSIRNPLLKAHKIGIYWRRKAMKALEKSTGVRTLFIIRRSFSGAQRTIELSPERARTEFIQSIIDGDFVLAPKGDGNYSNRFLEALSLGRIPVLIDTDIPLPRQTEIPYEKLVVRVPMNKVEYIDEYILSFYKDLTNKEWKERQKLATQTFRTFLQQDVFFKDFFAKSLSQKKHHA